MSANTRVLSGSRAGAGSAVVAETSTKTVNVVGIGVVNEAPSSGGGSTQTVRVMVLA